MRYQIEKNSNELRILGEEFVINNKNKGILIINNKKHHIKSVISKDNIEKKKIKMALNKNIFNKSYMFKSCESLLSISKKPKDNEIQYIQNDENKINNDEYQKDETTIISNTIDNFYFNCDQVENDFFTTEIMKEENLNNSSILNLNNELQLMKGNYIILKECF